MVRAGSRASGGECRWEEGREDCACYTSEGNVQPHSQAGNLYTTPAGVLVRRQTAAVLGVVGLWKNKVGAGGSLHSQLARASSVSVLSMHILPHDHSTLSMSLRRTR